MENLLHGWSLWIVKDPDSIPVESRPNNHVTEFAVHASVYGKVQNRLAHSSPRPLAVAYTHDAYFRPRHSSLTLQNAHRLIYASYRQMQSIPTGCWPPEAFGVTGI